MIMATYSRPYLSPAAVTLTTELFETVAKVKEPLLTIAAERLLAGTDALRSDFDQFCAKNADFGYLNHPLLLSSGCRRLRRAA